MEGAGERRIGEPIEGEKIASGDKGSSGPPQPGVATVCEWEPKGGEIGSELEGTFGDIGREEEDGIVCCVDRGVGDGT